MEKKEQERLEEILAMCAQYEEQIDSEIQINSPRQSKNINKPNPTERRNPPHSLGLTNINLSNYDSKRANTSAPSQMPG